MKSNIFLYARIIVFFILLFTVRIHAIEVIEPTPGLGSTGNPINTQIRFKIISNIDTAGVDLGTINVDVNGTDYYYGENGFSYSSLGQQYEGASYRIIITPEESFTYGDSVNVEVTADDFTGLAMEAYTWHFFILADNLAPLVWNQDPELGEDDQEPDVDIYFEITDDISGVDLNSVSVNVQTTVSGMDETYTIGPILDFESIDGGYSFLLDPAEDFTIADTVNVSVSVSDNAGNETEENYYFYIKSSLDYTYTGAYDPEPDATNVPVDTAVSFEIYNMVDTVYIDTTQIRVVIQGQQYTYANTDNFELEPIEYGYKVTVTRDNPFNYNQLVLVEIYARDTMGSMEPEFYSFRTVNDTAPPYIGSRDPFSGQQDVPVNTDIYFQIKDNLSGVDTLSLEVYIGTAADTTLYSYLDENFVLGEVDDGYEVTINPSDFNSEEEVTIEIYAEDFLENVIEDSYSFFTEVVSEDTLAPFITDYFPEDGAMNQPLNTVITLLLYDSDPGIDEESILLRVNGDNVAANIAPDLAYGVNELGHYIAYEVSYQINETEPGDISWGVRVADLIGNTYNPDIEEEFSFTCAASIPPYINLPEVFMFIEDNVLTVDFSDYAGDPDGDFPELIPSGNNNIEVDIASNMVTFSAPENWNGSEEIEFEVSDGSGIDSDIVTIEVIPANDAPTIDIPVDNYTLLEDATLTVDFTPFIDDVDGDELFLYATGQESVIISINNSNKNVTIGAEQDWFGEEAVTFTVIDNSGRLSDSETIDIIFESVDEPPVLTLPDRIIMSEDDTETIDFSDYIYEPEGQPVELAVFGDDEVDVDITGVMVTFTPNANWSGEDVMTFQVRDASSAWIEDQTTVRVIGVNDAPTINLPASASVDEDDVLVIDFSQYINDVDGDAVYLSSFGSQYIDVTIDSLTVEFAPIANWNGEETIDFVAQDIHGASVLDEIEVIVNPVNDIPQVNLPYEFSFAEDTNGVFNLNSYITDIDGDDLTINIAGGDSIQYDLTGMNLTLSAPEDWNGTELYFFNVNDGMGGSVNDSVFVTVIPVNDAPVVNLPSSISFDEDEELQINFVDSLYVTDIDDNQITILPSGNNQIDVSVYEELVVFSPAENWNGTEEITFLAIDGSGAVASGEMDVIINPVNDAPTINLPGEFSYAEGTELNVDMEQFVDDVDLELNDEEELSLECTGNTNVTVEIDELEVTFSSEHGWNGSETLTFTVADFDGLEASDNVNIVVNVWQNNHVPELNLPMPEIMFDEDTSYTIDFVSDSLVIDIDGDDILISVVQSNHFEVDENGSEVTFTPDENWNGSQTITFFADDQNGGIINGELELTVLPVDDVPEFNLPGSFNFQEDESLPLNLNNYVEEVDGDELSMEFSGNDNIVITDYGNLVVSLSIQGIWTGSELITFSISDANSTVSDTTLVTVTEGSLNHPPHFSEELPTLFEFNEDETFEFDFSDYILDEDEDDGFILQISNNNNVLFMINDLLVTLYAPENWNGNESLLFTVYDTPRSGRASDNQLINVHVLPVNDEPELDLPEYLTFTEGEDLTVNFSSYADDVDEDDELILNSPGGDSVFVDIFNIFSVTFTAADGFIGQEYISFTLNDGDLSAEDSLLIIVADDEVNNAPVIGDLPESVIFDEDTQAVIDFNQYVTDDEGDEWLIIFAENDHINAGQVNNVVTLYPENNWNGETTLDFIIYELRSRLQTEGSIDVVVEPVNDAPVINITEEILIEENDDPVWDFSGFISDIDSYNLDLEATGYDTIDVVITGDVVHFIPQENWFGTETVTFTVRDDSLAEDSQIVDITVTQGNFNHPPEINLPEEIVMDEDTELTVDFSQYVSDQDDLDVLFITHEYSENIFIEVDELEVTFTPTLNWNGEEDIDFWVHDSQGGRASATDEVTIVVNAVNDEPELDLPPSFTFEENGFVEVDFSLYMFDADGEYLNILSSGNENVTVSVGGGYIVTIGAVAGWDGSEFVEFRAVDGSMAEAADTVEVIVNPIGFNSPPEINLPDSLSLWEDTITDFDFSPYIYDEEGDDIIIRGSYSSNVAVDVTDSLVTLIPDENYYGTEEMTFTVYDSQGGRASAFDNVLVDVMAVNDPPTLELPTSFTFSNAQTLIVNFSPFMEDVDGESLDITFTGNDEIDIEISYPSVIIYCSDEYSGSEQVTFTVTDGEDESASDEVTLIAVSGSTNTAPEITLPAQFVFDEDMSLEIDFLADSLISDFEDDPLSLLVYGNDEIDVEIEGTNVTFSAGANWFGSEEVTFFVFDDEGGMNEGETEILINAVNDAPEIDLPDDGFEFVELESLVDLNFSDYIFDADPLDELSLSVEGNEQIIVEINNQWGPFIVNISAEAGFIGSEDLTFTVSDDSLSNSDVVTVTVNEGEWNHPPQWINFPGSVSIPEDSVYTADFSNYLEDVDQFDDIVLTVASVENMDIEINDLEVEITPDANWFGNAQIEFTAYDSPERAAADTILFFTVLPVNDAPVFDLPEVFEFEENDSYTAYFNNYMSDVDGDELEITWSGDDNITVEPGINNRIIFSEEDFTGTELIQFNVTDGQETVSDSVFVTVIPGQWNHPPEFENLPAEFVIEEDVPQQFDFGQYITDEDDNDQLIVSAQPNNFITVTVAEDTLVTLTSAQDYNGSTTITFVLIDNVLDRAVATAAVPVVVTPVNDTPTIELPLELSMTQEQVLGNINFAYFTDDVDEDNLFITSSGEENLDVDINQLLVTISLEEEDWFGEETLTFTVSDGFLQASDSLIVRVYQGSTNEPPEINLPDSFTFAEDSLLSVDLSEYISDEENDELFLTVSGNDQVQAEIAGLMVTFTAEADWFGTDEMIFYVFDDLGDRSTSFDDIEINVTPVNDAPVINILPGSFTYSQDDLPVQLNILSYLYDVDNVNEELDLTLSGNENLELEVLIEPFYIQISALQAFVGEDTVTFTLSDGSLQSSDTAIIEITPGEENLPPVLTLPDELTLLEDTPTVFNFSEYVDDPDGDDIVIWVNGEEYEHLVFGVNQLFVTITPARNWFGSEEVEFIIYDTEGRASDSGEVEVMVEAVNDDPVLNLPDSFSFTENEDIDVDFSEYASDVDMDFLSLSWDAPESIFISNQGLMVTFSAPDDWTGEEMVNFYLFDGTTTVPDSVLVIVELGDFNHAPEIDLPASWTMDEDSTMTLDFSEWIDDFDGDSLLISAAYNSNIGISIDEYMVTFIPQADYFGTATLTFTVTDNVRLQASDTVQLNVNSVNDAPMLNLPNALGFTQTEQLYENFNQYMSDIDDTELWIMPASGNENIGVEIFNDTKIVRFYLLNDDWHDSEIISFTVRDDELATATDSVEVTVYQGSVNNPPEITLPEFFDFDEDTELEINFAGEGYIYDEDGDDMTVTVSGNENVTVDITGTWVTLSALPDWNGNETLTFYVIDENDQANSDNVIVRVAAVNDAPQIEFPESGFTFVENTEFRVALSDYFSDIDNNSGFTLEYSGNDNVNLEILQGDPVYFVEFTAAPDWFGEDTLSFTISDSEGESDSDDVIFHVTGSSNHAPQINLPESFSFDEDEPFTFDLTEYISDPEGDDILIYFEESSHIDIAIDPDTLVTLTPDENWNGSETISFTIFDSEPGFRLSASDEVEIIVNPVNDPPLLDLPEEIVFEENGNYQFNFGEYASDPEGEFLEIGYSGNDTIIVDVSNYNIMLSAPEFWFGEEVITFTAMDSDSLMAIDSTLVIVEMGDYNHAPEINLPEEGFTVVEDEEIVVNFQPYISDEDGDNLIITSEQVPEVSVNIVGNLVRFTPAANYNGTVNISFTVIDDIGERLSATDDVDLVVTPVNDPPLLDIPPEFSLSVEQYRWLNFGSFITDIDEEDSHSLEVSGNDLVQLGIDDLQVEFYSNFVCSETITFTVEDGAGETAIDSMIVRVYAGQVNNEPTISLPAQFSFYEDEQLIEDLSQYVFDPDGDELTLWVTGGNFINVNTVVIENVIFSAGENQNGSETLTFIVSDGNSISTDVASVQVIPVNDDPVIDLPENGFSFSEDTYLTIPFNMYMYDVDEDDLTITYSGNNDIDITVYDNIVQLYCEDPAEELITFTVDDNQGGIASDEVTITVSAGMENHSPVINLPVSITTDEDVPLNNLNFEAFVSDPDGDPLYITCNNYVNTTVVINGFSVNIIPDEDWNGTETLTFSVIDIVRRDMVSASTNIIVNPVNDPPQIDLPYYGFSFDEDESINRDFNQFVSDVDGDDITLTCDNNVNVNVNISDLSVSIFADPNWSGSETLTFTVDDNNGETASDEISINVNPLNDPPYVETPLENFTIDEDSIYYDINLNDVFSDFDLAYGDELDYSVFGDINLQVDINQGAVTITPANNWFGMETLTFRATDQSDLFVEDNVAVTVSSVNDNPIVVVEPSLTAQADTTNTALVWLDATGSYDIDGTIESVTWSWEGGSAQGMVVQEEFSAGYYEITATAEDNQGGIGTAVTYLSVSDYNNESPVAHNDSYEVYETQELIVYPASGLLANDYDPDEYPQELTAVLVSPPTDGTLTTFNPDGSFIYLADNIVNHDVTFTYQAFDGQAYSLIKTVNITVNEIVLEDAEITINSVEVDSSGTVLSIPVLTSDLIPEWDVRNFAFDLQFTSGVIEYNSFDLQDALVDSTVNIQIEENRGSLHCTCSSNNVISGEGALLNINFDFYLGHSPLQITNFQYNDTSIQSVNIGAVNNNYPYLETAITFPDSVFEDFEPFSIDLNNHFSDDDNDVLSYTVEFEEEEVMAEIADNLLLLSSVQDYSGNTQITVTATDGYTLTEPEEYEFNMMIHAQNDAPQMVLPDSFTFLEDSTLTVNMLDYVSDPDMDALTLTWSGNENISLSVDMMQLTFSAPPDWFGSEMITIEADDNINGRLMVSDSLLVIVEPVNDIPEFNLPVSFSLDEDVPETFDFLSEGYVSDLENDDIILSIADNEFILAEFDGTSVTLSAPLNWNGNEDVIFIAHDDQDTTSVSATIQIIVHPVNDPPVLNFPPDGFQFDENTTAEENTINFADSIIYDPDNEILDITVDDGEFINITIEGTFVSFEPVPNWDGSERRTFTVTDNVSRDQVSGSVRIYVYDTEPNQAPVIELPPQGFTFAEDGQLNINFADSLTAGYVYDPEGSDVFLSIGGSSNITSNVVGLEVALGAVPDFFGSDQIVITAHDFDPEHAAAVDTVLINVTAVNDPPDIDLPDNIVLVGDTTRVINFGQYLDDVDNDINDLQLSATGNDHVGIEIFNTVVSFAAPESWEGQEVIYFEVIDNGTVPAQDSLIVIVEQEQINHPPQISLPASLTFEEDGTLSHDFSAYISDPDDDNLFLQASGNDNIHVVINNYQVNFSAEENWNGNEIILFTVYDTRSRDFASEDMQINVTPVNDAPVFEPVYDLIMERDQVLEVNFGNYVSDLEDNSFTLSLSEGEGVNIEQNGNVFTFTPQAGCPPMQNLTLTAEEDVSGISSFTMFGLFVMEPAVDLPGLEEAVKNGEFTFMERSGEHEIDFADFLNTDYDNLILESPLNGIASDSIFIEITGYKVNFTPQKNWIGDIYIPFAITYLQNRARRDFEVKVTVRAERSEEYVEPRPHLVSWEWDTCEIIITTGEPMAGESCKILNKSGKLIRKLPIDDDIGSNSRYRAVWDKKNEDGDPVNGGLYIYQVDIAGKIYQGSIIIAR